MKVGDKVRVTDPVWFYNADGEIIRETKLYWIVKITNHKTSLTLWPENEQKEKIVYYHKNCLMSKGYSKGLRYGNFTEISEVKDETIKTKTG